MVNFLVRVKTNLLLAGLFVVFIVVMQHLNVREISLIKAVKVYGVKHINHDQLQTLLLPCVSTGFFGVNLELIIDKLKQFAWVEHVSVTRVWPATIEIFVHEHVPVALWNKKNILLSKNGSLFAVENSSEFDDLPIFTGPDGTQNQMLAYFKKLQALLKLCNLTIKQFKMNADAMLEIKCSNGIELRVGHKNIFKRLNHFIKVYPKIMNRAINIEYIDLRYSNGMAIKFKDHVRGVKSGTINYG